MVLRFTPILAAVFATTALIAAPETHAADDDVVSTKQNLHVYKGNTALGTSPSGRKFRVYFGTDGTVSYSDSKGLSQKGKWLITDDGMMCYDWQRWKDRCYSHRKDGDGFQSYREGKTKGSRFTIAPGKVELQK
ncbi:MAG: hypothetical protein GKS00_09645 [Alphaproteobacteria bacterium]|nr:hypothetical protein [Alphaproteobacteria bacterium]